MALVGEFRMMRSDTGAVIKLAGSAAAVSELKNSLVFRALKTKKLKASVKSETHDLPPHAFSIKTSREAYRLRQSGAKIRTNLDVCIVETPDGARAAFAEAVFVLKKGDAHQLSQIICLFLEESRGALRVSTASRYASALSALDKPARLQKIATSKEHSTRETLYAALSANIEDMTAFLRMVVDQRSPAGLQKMRVALRRFRSLEQLFRKSGKTPALRALNKEAAIFARRLGIARDWDVFVDQTLVAISSGGVVPDGFNKLRKGAEKHRMKAWQEAADMLASERFSVFILSALELNIRIGQVEHHSDDRAVTEYAPAMLDLFYEKACACAVDLSEKPPSAGHPLRLAIKKLRFAVRTLKDLYPQSETKPYLAALAQLQNRFGIMNDAVVAQSLAQQAAQGQGAKVIRASGFVSGYRGAEAYAAAAKLVDEWAAFERITPFWREN